MMYSESDFWNSYSIAKDGYFRIFRFFTIFNQCPAGGTQTLVFRTGTYVF